MAGDRCQVALRLQDVHCVAESLRMRVIQQEFHLGKLKEKLAEKAAAQKHCKKSRRKERSFLVSLISQYKGEASNLTDISCKEACRRKKVKPRKLKRRRSRLTRS